VYTYSTIVCNYGGIGIHGGLVQYDWFRVDAETFYSRTETAI
jgi:hypothetical protein